MRHTIVSNRVAGVLLITTLSLALTSVCPAQTNVRGKTLFQATNAQWPSNAKRRFPGVLRARPVSIDLKTIATLRKGDTLQLKLFDDLDLRGEITYYRRTHRGTQQWAGHLPGLPGSSILLAEAEGAIAGLIRGPGLEIIRLHSAGGGRYEVIQLEAERQSECGVDLGRNFLPRLDENPFGVLKNKSAVGGGTSCDSGLVIDLMVVYSAEARDAAANMQDGDPSFILAEIDLAELDVNTSYANSLINPRINVVHSALLLQGETPSFSGMLNQLTNISDGQFDEVHALRNLHGADMVAMLVANSSLGGVAWIMDSLDPGFEEFAFSVNNWARAADSVLAHELGHNQGCCHDRNNCGVGIFSYSYGHRYIGTDAIQYRTVMSYLPGTWIKHYSSPLVNFAGEPTGEIQTDNARTINETAAIIANFRQTALPPPAALAGVGQERLVAPVRVMDDFFGISVAIDGDIAVVGADMSDEGGFVDTGAAFVYRFDGFAWQWEATLTASDASASDSFGRSVAIDGDLIVVGATQTDDPGVNSGSAYVFRYDGVNWNEEAKLVALDAGSFDLAGTSVDISGNRVVVGAPQHNDNGPDSGSVFVYEFNIAEGIWEEQQKLVADDAAFGDNFGQSVSISGDLLIVGAWLDNEGIQGDSGAAYVFGFDIASQMWNQDAKLQAPVIGANSYFGVSVSLSPDATNGDVILVGAYGADGIDVDEVTVPGSGSAYVYRDTGSAWVFEQELPVPSSLIQGDLDSGFGFAVTVGENIAAVGVPFSGVGAFARYEFGGTFWSNTATVINATDESLGISIDNDPVTNDIIAGAWTADNFAGAAYVLNGDAVLNDCNENGLPDDCDILNGFSLDCNTNGIPDECDILEGFSLDCNNNLIPDECDITDGTDADCDMNGVPDGCDIDQGLLDDVNMDGIADLCQDCNDNGTLDPVEIAADPSLDCNLNGVLDSCDIADGTSEDVEFPFGIPDECVDCNGNLIPDFQDIIDGTSIDADDNGIPDECDLDCDNDGVPDSLQILQGVHPDCNLNGIPDVCDIADLTSGDCNGNGIPDSCDIAEGLLDDVNMDGIDDACQDCNLNGILDPEDIATETSRDCNLSGIPDECESGDRNENGIPDFCEDCNNNLIADHLDVLSGFSLDLDGNTVPDECERDCNLNGILDPLDLANGTSRDCNLSGIPDECESGDRNGNGIPDFCEDCNNNLKPDYLDVILGTSTDINGNTIPDECDQPGDVNNDLLVNVDDLIALLANWGPCVVSPCIGDLDFSGTVDVSDLVILLANWGA